MTPTLALACRLGGGLAVVSAAVMPRRRSAGCLAFCILWPVGLGFVVGMGVGTAAAS